MASKKKQPKSWSDRLNPAEAIEETLASAAAKKLTSDIEQDLFGPGMLPRTPLLPKRGETLTDFKNRIIATEPKPPAGLLEQVRPTPDQITIKCLQRELYLAKARILELELRADGVKI